MTGTLPFDAPATPARATDPQTSHDAARSVRKETLHRGQLAVLRVLAEGRMTHEALLERYEVLVVVGDPESFPPQSQSGLRTRCAELVDKGYVKDSGMKERLRSRRWAVRWEITESGRALLAETLGGTW